MGCIKESYEKLMSYVYPTELEFWREEGEWAEKAFTCHPTFSQDKQYKNVKDILAWTNNAEA